MSEYYTVKLGKHLSYEGYFDFAKLWRLVRTFMGDRGYGYMEKEHNEMVKEKGKDIFIHVDVERELSTYVRTRIVTKCTVSHLTDVEIQHDGKHLSLNEGNVSFEFEAYVITDFEGRFAGKGSRFFIRTVLEKFIFNRQIKKFERIANDDLEALIKEVKAYLNLFTY